MVFNSSSRWLTSYFLIPTTARTHTTHPTPNQNTHTFHIINGALRRVVSPPPRSSHHLLRINRLRRRLRRCVVGTFDGRRVCILCCVSLTRSQPPTSHSSVICRTRTRSRRSRRSRSANPIAILIIINIIYDFVCHMRTHHATQHKYKRAQTFLTARRRRRMCDTNRARSRFKACNLLHCRR